MFLGLRPTKGKNGPGDIPKLKQAQQLRAIAEGVLGQLTKQTVLGHSQMSSRLGASYLVKMFDCNGKLACLSKLVAPLAAENVAFVFAGDYYGDDGTYFIHIYRFSATDGALQKEVTFKLSSDAAENPEKWRPNLEPLIDAAIGRVKIKINEKDALCRVDGLPCTFEPDGVTMVLPVGEHQLEVSKDGFTTEKVPVVIELGAAKTVDVELKPREAEESELRVPAALGRRAPSLPVVRIDSPPKIDGKLDDLVWAKAWVDPNFTQNFPDEGKAPTQRTEVRVTYDNEALYVAVRCFDTEPNKIIARLTRRDRDIETDKVTVDISSKNDRTSAYHFQVSAAGTQVDGLRFNDTDYTTDLDTQWYVETSRDDRGWSAEFKIPFVALRYNGDVTSFGFQVRRHLQRLQEVDEWAYVPRTAKGEVSYYGTITGIKGLKAQRLFQVVPYDSRTITVRKGQGDFDGTSTGGNFGADLKVGITPALTLDGTINPDFGTVEVDQVILNLSTVEAYFPEKRPFFLEGTDVFSMPYQLFYTRRVGGSPPSPTLTGEATLAEPVAAGRIWNALKLTGLLTPRLSIGVINAITARRDAVIVRTPGGPREKVLVEPLTNFGVLRLRQQVGTSSAVGAMLTSVNRFEPKNAATPEPGDLCPVPYTSDFTVLAAPSPSKGRCSNDAYTGGVDTVLRNADGSLGASAQVIGSMLMFGPKRQVPDGTIIGSGSKGVGLTSEVGRYGGEHWLYHAGYRNASPRLQINDAGFLGQANFHEISGAVTWRTQTPIGPVQQADVTASFGHKRDWTFTDNLSTESVLSAGMQFKNFWTLHFDLEPYFPVWVDNRETQDGARTERSSGYVGIVDAKTDPSKSAVVSFSGYVGKKQRGRYYSVLGTLSVRPGSAIELDVTPSFSYQYGVPRWQTTEDNGDGSNTYFFADLKAKSFDVTLRGTLAFTRRLSLQAYFQPFIASGHYGKATTVVGRGANPLLKLSEFQDAPTAGLDSDFRYGSVNLNVFLRWEYLPLSAFWLVYTRSQDQTPYDAMEGPAKLRFDRFSGGPSTDVLLAKISYVW